MVEFVIFSCRKVCKMQKPAVTNQKNWNKWVL